MIKKICGYLPCSTDLETNNSKKKFCGTHCKNANAYWIKQELYEWEFLAQKGRRNNIKILEHLVWLKIFRVSRDELIKLGFDFIVAYAPDEDFDKHPVFRFGNIYMILVSKTEFIIELIKEVK